MSSPAAPSGAVAGLQARLLSSRINALSLPELEAMVRSLEPLLTDGQFRIFKQAMEAGARRRGGLQRTPTA